jgi:luciferase family oxidoreductase group 1
VLLAHVGGGTSRIRVGSGGIMLPNHAPLQVAEQFGTLASLFPGRVDLGLGRAPGTDHAAARALRRTLQSDPEGFPNDVIEVMAFFDDPRPGQAVVATPGAGLHVPVWILGSSTFGAQVAAALGLPFAFASHFAPAMLFDAIRIYRERFQPSAQLPAPYVMLGANIVAAATDDRQVHGLVRPRERRGAASRAPGDAAAAVAQWMRDAFEPADPLQRTRVSFVGSAATVHAQLDEFVARTGADEVIVTSHIHDHAARLRSYEIAAAWLTRGAAAAAPVGSAG